MLIYEFINFFCLLLNCVGRILSTVAKISLYILWVSFYYSCYGFWIYCISIFFAINDLDSLLNFSTGNSILELFNQILENKIGTICLEILLVATGFRCIIVYYIWQFRIC